MLFGPLHAQGFHFLLEAANEQDLGERETLPVAKKRLEVVFHVQIHEDLPGHLLLVDIGEAVESPEAAAAMHEHLQQREPLFVRSLVVVFQAWHDKTWPSAVP